MCRPPCHHPRRIPAFLLGAALLGPILAAVSASVPPSGLPLIGARTTRVGTARTTAVAAQAPPRGGAASTAAAGASFAGLDADTLRSLGVDESEIGELFVDETDGEFAAPANRRRQRRAVVEVETEDDEDEYEWEESEDDDDDEAAESADEDESESELDEEDGGDEEEYDYEEYEEYEDEDEDVGEEWWRDPLAKYQDDDDEYEVEEVEESEDEECDEKPAQRQGGKRSSASKTMSKNKKKPRAASAKSKPRGKAKAGKTPSFGLPSFGGKQTKGTTSSALTKRRSQKSSTGSSMTTSWNVPTPLGSVRVQLPAGATLGPLTTVIGAIGTFATNTSPTVPIILSLAMANFFLGLIRHAHPQQPSSSEEEEEYVDQSGYQQYNDGYGDEMDENYGFERQQQEQDYEDIPMEEDGGLDAYQQQQDQYPEDDAESAARGPNVLTRLASSMPKVPSLFGRGDGQTERRIRRNRRRSFRRDDEVRALYERAEAAEAERDTIEHEYELSSRQLQGQQQQLQALSKTNAYLKAQLRDIQRSSESAVLAERKKADEEMARVRESLVDVLERERRLMRAQMMKASDRLRTLMEDEADALSEDDGPEFAK